MKMHRRTDFILYIVCAFLCAAGMQQFALSVLGISGRYSLPVTCAVCAACMLVLILMTLQLTIFLSISAILCIWILIISISGKSLYKVYDTILGFFRWIGPFLSGTGRINGEFEKYLVLAVVCILSFLCFIIVCRIRNSLLLLLVSAGPVLALKLFTAKEISFILLLPLVFGNILLFALTANQKIRKEKHESAQQTGYHQTVVSLFPMVLVGLVLSFLLSYAIPAERLRSQNVVDTTNDILSMLHLPLPGMASRMTFNLGSIGFYPLNSRLGGPVNLDDSPVMTVTSSSSVLLRATTYNTYEKNYWSSSGSIFSSRFESSILSARTKDAFDMNRPDKSKIPSKIYNAVLQKETITVSNITHKIGSTLFAADHLLEVDNSNKSVYYNQSAEIFQNEKISVGQTYSLTVNKFKTSSGTFDQDLLALEAYIIAHRASQDSAAQMKTIRDSYLDVTVPSSVTAYARSLTDDSLSPLQKVIVIRDTLRSQFTYSLDVEIPPENADFVEHFLFTKTGYCTYFASAMTVLARINGIPARYTEGFSVVVPGEATVKDPAHVTVTGKSGHAWCEVYISGIGWIPVDATASSNSGTPLPNDGGTGIVTPTPAPNPDDTANPSGIVTPAPSPDVTGSADDKSDPIKFFLLSLIPLIILLISLVLFLSRRIWNKRLVLMPLSGLKDSVPTQEIVTHLWKRSLNHLSLLNISIESPETVADFSKRIKSVPAAAFGSRKGTYNFDITHIAKLYDQWIFGRYLPSDDELNLAFSECRKLVSDVKNAHYSKFLYALHILIRTGKSSAKEYKES